MAREAPTDPDQLMRQLQARHPMKTWSLVITFLGDCVLPRGGTVPLAVIVHALQSLGIDATTVRAAVARLTQDGWLVRERRGRASDYRLDAAGLDTFATAEARIYAADDPAFTGRWHIAAVHAPAGSTRNALRKTLRSQGFGALSSTTFIRPVSAQTRALTDVDGVSVFEAEHSGGSDPEKLLRSAFDLAAIDALYQHFVHDFEPMLGRGDADSGETAVALRTAMIHEYRRVLLRDPHLPHALTPTLRHRAEARAIASTLYHQWLQPSEAWLDASHAGWRHRPDDHLAMRFA